MAPDLLVHACRTKVMMSAMSLSETVWFIERPGMAAGWGVAFPGDGDGPLKAVEEDLGKSSGVSVDPVRFVERGAQVRESSTIGPVAPDAGSASHVELLATLE